MSRISEHDSRPLETAHNERHSSIAIVAVKRLVYNTRVYRQARSLSEAGHRVTVVCLELPHRELRDATPQVEYIEYTPRSLMLAGGVGRGWWSSAFRRLRLVGKLIGLGATALGLSLRKAISVIRSLVRFCFVLPVRKGIHCSRRRRWGQWAVRRGGKCVRAAKRTLRDLRMKRRSLERRARSALTRIANSSLWSALRHNNKAILSARFASRVVSELGNRPFDYCQAHDSYSLPAAYRLAKRTRAKLIYDAVEAPVERSGVGHGARPKWLVNKESKRDREIIRKAETVFCVGPSLAEWTREHYGLRSTPTVVRNCRLLREDRPTATIREDLGLPDEARLVLLLGSIYQNQGVEQLVEAVQFLRDEVHFGLLGPISQPGYEEELRGRIDAADAEDRIHFCPVQPQHMVLDYASGADMGIIARQQGALNDRLCMPNKIFELVMARLPVACSRLQDIAALVTQHEIGEVFDETDPASIARTVERMLFGGEFQRYRQAAREAARELCWERESENFLAVFDPAARRRAA